MKLVSNALVVSVAAVVLILAGNFLWTQHYLAALEVIGAGALILSAPRQGSEWLSSAGFFGLVVLSAFGIWAELHPLWMLAAVTGSLAAWNLARQEGRLSLFESLAGSERLQRNYLLRLISVAALGFGLGAAALYVEVDLTFGMAILLSLVAVVGVAWVIQLLRSPEISKRKKPDRKPDSKPDRSAG